MSVDTNWPTFQRNVYLYLEGDSKLFYRTVLFKNLHRVYDSRSPEENKCSHKCFYKEQKMCNNLPKRHCLY